MRRLRQAWPRTEILFRGDSHFTYPEVMAYLEAQPRMHDVTGLGTNSVLKRLAKEFRLFLHSAAQVLLWALRAEVLGRSSWSRVRFETLALAAVEAGGLCQRRGRRDPGLPGLRRGRLLPFSCPVASIVRRSFSLLGALPGL